jgi:hypothetical protein
MNYQWMQAAQKLPKPEICQPTHDNKDFTGKSEYTNIENRLAMLLII